MKKLINFNLNPRARILAYVAGGVIFLFLFEKFFFSNLRARIKTIDKEIRLKEVELKTGVGIQDKKGQIGLDYKIYSGYLGDQKASAVDNQTAFLKELEGIAQKTGVSIVNLTPDNQSKEVGGSKVFYADARLEATVDQFYSFLGEIQNSKLLIKIDKLTISAKDENASSLRLDTTISMTAL